MSITAQHDETGRLWTGPREQLPPRYIPIMSEPIILISDQAIEVSDYSDPPAPFPFEKLP